MTPRISPAPRRAPSLVAAVAFGLVAGLILVGCGDDGKTLRSPPPGATAPLRPTTTSAPTATVSPPIDPGLLTLRSTDFEPGNPLADAVTCQGQGRAPGLTWSGLPEGTVEVAVGVVDTDDDLFTNWIVAGIDPAIASGTEPGALPAGAVEATNDEGAVGYAAPCAPDGEQHLIEFTLYALSAPSGVTSAMNAAEAQSALENAPGTRAVITATVDGS